MKNIFTVLLLLFISLPSLSQDETVNQLLDEFLFGKNPQDSILEAILVNEADINDLINAIGTYKFIYLRSEFENKTYFSGEDIGIDQFNIANQLFYQGPKGLNVGVAGILYSGFIPHYNTTIISAGYNNNIPALAGTSIRTSYNRFFFSKNDSIEENAFNSSINLGTTFKSRIIGTSVDFTLLLGNDPSTQLSWDLFSELTVLRFGLFNELKLVPEVSFYFGNETVATSYYLNPRSSSGEIVTEDRTFGLRNTVVRIPVMISFRSFDIRAGYNFNFPRAPGEDYKPGNTSFFNISIGYILGFYDV